MSWDWNDIPWEPFVIVILIFGLLFMIGLSWRQDEIINQKDNRIKMLMRELDSARQSAAIAKSRYVTANGRNGD